jgi:hypothetical protein
MSGSVIVAGARTPIGRLLGGLKDQSAADLGGVAIKGALEKAGVSGDQVEYVIMGQVIQAGAGQITARQAAVKGGIPMNIPAITINKVCLSGINAIALADQLIRAGEHDVVVAGGMESMTQAPHLLPKSREGFKYGDTKLVDSMAYDALFDAFTQQGMGNLTDACNVEGLGLSREEQDEFSARSHQRAAAAWKNGVFDDEVVPVEIPQRRGEPVVVTETDAEAEAYLARPDCAVRYYFHYLSSLMKRAGFSQVMKGVEKFDDEKLTVDWAIDNIVIAGSPATVAEKLLAVRDQIGPFGTIVLTGVDWDDQALWKRSMALMASEVMPLLRQTAAAAIAAK